MSGPLPKRHAVSRDSGRVTQDTGTQEERVISQSTELSRDSPPKVREEEAGPHNRAQAMWREEPSQGVPPLVYTQPLRYEHLDPEKG